MNNQLIIVLLFSALSSFGQTQRITSPGGIVIMEFTLDNDGRPFYNVSYKNKEVIKNSALGIQFADGGIINNLEVTSLDTCLINETWNPVLGEVKTIRNHYRQLVVKLIERGHPLYLHQIQKF